MHEEVNLLYTVAIYHVIKHTARVHIINLLYL